MIGMQLMDGAVATANANPSLVLADMDALTRQCDAQLAEHDAQLSRLAAGIATLEDERAAVLSKRQEVMGMREQALRVHQTLLAAAQAGTALRDGQRDGRTSSKDAATSGEREDAGVGSPSAEMPVASTAAEEDSLAAASEAPAAFDAAKLGPRGMQALRIIDGAPGQQWTPKLLAVQLEGTQAEADGKAHNRARTLMDDLAKKQLVKKHSSGKPRRCHFVAVSAAEDA